MQELQVSPDIINAAEPIIRFVSKKLAYDDISSSELERATAKRAVEAAAWSVCVMPETADILNDSPVVRAEMLRLLDLEHDDCYAIDHSPDESRARLAFASSIWHNPRLFMALSALAPDLAQQIEHLAK